VKETKELADRLAKEDEARKTQELADAKKKKEAKELADRLAKEEDAEKAVKDKAEKEAALAKEKAKKATKEKAEKEAIIAKQKENAENAAK